MGGHGLYVWSVYGISIVALVVLGAWPLRAEKKLLMRATEHTDLVGGS
ncbi:MAG: heme exporter protein CcmD [Pseudomonadales bacterium]